MSDLLYALEIWMLVAALLGWLLGRAAARLHEPIPYGSLDPDTGCAIEAAESDAGLDPPRAGASSWLQALHVYDEAEPIRRSGAWRRLVPRRGRSEKR